MVDSKYLYSKFDTLCYYIERSDHNKAEALIKKHPELVSKPLH